MGHGHGGREIAARARARNPNTRLYGLRIGYPAASAIGTTLRPLREEPSDDAR